MQLIVPLIIKVLIPIILQFCEPDHISISAMSYHEYYSGF